MNFDACIARLTRKEAKDTDAFAQQITEESRASNARWDGKGNFNALLDEVLSHATDAKPITAHQCVTALEKINGLEH